MEPVTSELSEVNDLCVSGVFGACLPGDYVITEDSRGFTVFVLLNEVSRYKDSPAADFPLGDSTSSHFRACKSLCKLPVIFVTFLSKLECFQRF
jgi:hypothetical protein